MSAKEEYLQIEGDAWFLRNHEKDKENKNKGILCFCDFYERMKLNMASNYNEVLEIGCCYGYGLVELIKKYNFTCNGIDPSSKAIEYGTQLYENIILSQKLKLVQGTSDNLPYKDNSMDVVFFGFCLYQVERNLLMKSVYEADRVLRDGGMVVITDFDTPLQYKRANIHNLKCPTWKMDYAKMFLPMGYTLVEKKTYTHENDGFTPNIQERVSTQFIYKEHTQDLWREL